MKNKLAVGIVLTGVVLTSCAQSPQKPGQAQPPFADIHLHYNWDQEEIIDPATVVERLKEQNIVLGVVSSVPSDYALKLHEAGGDWIIPLFSPYITVPHRQSWYLDDAVVEQARAGLEAKHYRGIGELHLWSGLPPRQDNKVLLALFELAREYDVPFLLHTETSKADYIVPICQQHKDVRILWAHAGGILKPADVENAMQACANLWVELSARDPWRYASLVSDDGTLPKAWRELIVKYPDRFMTGTDPVWGVTKTQRWDEPDEGWDHLPKLIDFHRKWLAELPPHVEEQVRLLNARDFFRATVNTM
ncbi:MAG: amidohydrolase family protein [Thioalkalispiraceae bacterium]|jgi:predicted TIM-barrel fold metal-dependent hydrolase